MCRGARALAAALGGLILGGFARSHIGVAIGSAALTALSAGLALAYSLNIGFLAGGMFAWFAGVPIVLIDSYGVRPDQFGYLMLTGTSGAFFGYASAIWLTGKLGVNRMIVIGTFIALCGGARQATVVATALVVRFGAQPTNRGGMNGMADCGRVLADETAAALQGTSEAPPQCYWDDDSTLVALLDSRTPASPATARARRVLPVPGGPMSSTPRGIFAPIRWYFSGVFRKEMISSNSSLASSAPATSENVTFGVSGEISLALERPNWKARFPPPCMVRKIQIQNAMKRSHGSAVRRNVPHPASGCSASTMTS